MSKIHVIVTTTKPAGAQWYRDIEPEKNKTLNKWVRNFSGLLFLWGRETTPTTWKQFTSLPIVLLTMHLPLNMTNSLFAMNASHIAKVTGLPRQLKWLNYRLNVLKYICVRYLDHQILLT